MFHLKFPWRLWREFLYLSSLSKVIVEHLSSWLHSNSQRCWFTSPSNIWFIFTLIFIVMIIVDIILATLAVCGSSRNMDQFWATAMMKPNPKPLGHQRTIFIIIIMLIFIILVLQCSVNVSKVTQLYVCIVFFILSYVMFFHKWLVTVTSAMQQDLIGYPVHMQ